MFLGMDSISKERLQQRHSWKNLHLHWPWSSKKSPLPPKGHVAVRVGAEGERRRRFVVPVGHLEHPLFATMLDAAEAEFGFHQTGAIVIPCRVDYFRCIESVIDHDAAAREEHQRTNQRCQRSHLRRFVACFRT
ncbi:Auxin-responsive protein SAUR32 [Ananas comosus]|uniref:Auxin-responsive protein SAUR32 n=1 Tax=Ananas comosus TaxID=4615 RepID=A0A199VR97_ANACO|nr:Auxin-responsive protein SAUR32 [Ananas comosus]